MAKLLYKHESYNFNFSFLDKYQRVFSVIIIQSGIGEYPRQSITVSFYILCFNYWSEMSLYWFKVFKSEEWKTQSQSAIICLIWVFFTNRVVKSQQWHEWRYCNFCWFYKNVSVITSRMAGQLSMLDQDGIKFIGFLFVHLCLNFHFSSTFIADFGFSPQFWPFVFGMTLSDLHFNWLLKDMTLWAQLIEKFWDMYVT